MQLHLRTAGGSLQPTFPFFVMFLYLHSQTFLTFYSIRSTGVPEPPRLLFPPSNLDREFRTTSVEKCVCACHMWLAGIKRSTGEMLASLSRGRKLEKAPSMTDVKPPIGSQITTTLPWSGKGRRTVSWRGVRLDNHARFYFSRVSNRDDRAERVGNPFEA